MLPSCNFDGTLMKQTLYILLTMFFALSLAAAQSADGGDTTRAKQRVTKESSKPMLGDQPGGMMQQKLKGFVDEDGDGIDDRIQRMQEMHQGKEMMHDRFIDLDGDGINDNRCGPMGLTKQKGKTSRSMHR